MRSAVVNGGKPWCLVDHSPRWAGSPRNVLAQPCLDAVEAFDGREVWLIHTTPNLTRWYDNIKVGVMVKNLEYPVVSTITD